MKFVLPLRAWLGRSMKFTTSVLSSAVLWVVGLCIFGAGLIGYGVYGLVGIEWVCIVIGVFSITAAMIIRRGLTRG